MKPTIFSSQNTIRYNEKSKFEEKILIFEILRKNLKSIPKLGHVTLPMARSSFYQPGPILLSSLFMYQLINWGYID